MDPRCVPEQYFGPSYAGPSIRNAGGRATEDAIRSVTCLRTIAGLTTVVVVHHTGTKPSPQPHFTSSPPPPPSPRKTKTSTSNLTHTPRLWRPPHHPGANHRRRRPARRPRGRGGRPRDGLGPVHAGRVRRGDPGGRAGAAAGAHAEGGEGVRVPAGHVHGGGHACGGLIWGRGGIVGEGEGEGEGRGGEEGCSVAVF